LPVVYTRLSTPNLLIASVKPNEAGRIFATIASRKCDVYQKIVQPSLLKALKSLFSSNLFAA